MIQTGIKLRLVRILTSLNLNSGKHFIPTVASIKADTVKILTFTLYFQVGILSLTNIKNSDMRFMSLATSLPKKTADNKSAVF